MASGLAHLPDAARRHWSRAHGRRSTPPAPFSGDRPRPLLEATIRHRASVTATWARPGHVASLASEQHSVPSVQHEPPLSGAQTVAWGRRANRASCPAAARPQHTTAAVDAETGTTAALLSGHHRVPSAGGARAAIRRDRLVAGSDMVTRAFASPPLSTSVSAEAARRFALALRQGPGLSERRSRSIRPSAGRRPRRRAPRRHGCRRSRWRAHRLATRGRSGAWAARPAGRCSPRSRP